MLQQGPYSHLFSLSIKQFIYLLFLVFNIKENNS